MPAAAAGQASLVYLPQTRETVRTEGMVILLLVLLREGDVVRCVLDIEDIDAQTAYTVHKDSSVCMDTALLRVLGHSLCMIQVFKKIPPPHIIKAFCL